MPPLDEPVVRAESLTKRFGSVVAVEDLSFALEAVVVPSAMAFAVLATANHYGLDVLVGCVVALTALVLVSRVRLRA